MTTYLKIIDAYEEYLVNEEYYGDPDDPYSSFRETHTDHDIQGAIIVDKDKYWDIVINDDVSVGDVIHLLYVIYTHGSSFDRAVHGGIEYIAAVKDGNNNGLLILHEAKKAIDEDDQKNRFRDDISVSVKIPLPDENNEKKIVKISAPWKGYFEDLDDIVIERVDIIGDERNSK